MSDNTEANRGDNSCSGCKSPRLGYLAWHRDAGRRHKRGERQRLCPACGLWTWPEYLKPQPAPEAKP